MKERELLYRLREATHGWRWEVLLCDVVIETGIERDCLAARVAATNAAMDLFESGGDLLLRTPRS